MKSGITDHWPLTTDHSHPASDIGVRIFKTALGWAAVAATEQGLCISVLPRPSLPEALEALRVLLGPLGLDPGQAASDFQQPLLDRAERELCAYYSGQAVRFDLPLDLSTQTLFGQQVLAAVRDIGFGKTGSYGGVAARVGRPGAARAVGQAVGRNPLPPIIPCHRVIAADGSLGGFGSGLEMKRRLLELERKAR